MKRRRLLVPLFALLTLGLATQAASAAPAAITPGTVWHDTFVNNFKIIGEGSAPNFLETDVIHLTVNANGVPGPVATIGAYNGRLPSPDATAAGGPTLASVT